MLSSYGLISGTADVNAAVEIGAVHNSNDTVVLVKNTNDAIEAKDSMEVFNATQGSGEASIASSSDLKMTASTDTKSFDVDLSGVDSVGLKIDGTVLETVSIG